MAGDNLTQARKNKNDEFYTQLSDIEKEIRHYKSHFQGKTVFCNCDDPEWSNFWKYFALNFEELGLKKLISTHYEQDKPSYKLEIVRDENGDGRIDDKDVIKTNLTQNGDFRSDESIEILKEADIVVTNPPFSLFREYIAQLIKFDKKFLIIGNQNSVTYKEVFPLIRNNKVWLGASLDGRNIWYRVPDSYEKYHKIENNIKYAFVASTIWFTNLEHSKRNEEIILWKSYYENEEDYPQYDSYDAININKVVQIPMDYDGALGVPITFLHKYNPNQFEILDANNYIINNQAPIKEHGLIKDKDGKINGKNTYARILIKKKEINNEN